MHIKPPPPPPGSRAGCSTSGTGLQHWGIPDRETRSPPRLRPNPGPGLCDWQRLCFLKPTSGAALFPLSCHWSETQPPPNPSSIGSPCKRSLHSPLSSDPGPFWNRRFLNKGSLSKCYHPGATSTYRDIYQSTQHNVLILSLHYGTVLFCLNS